MATSEKSENKSKVLVNVYEPLIAIMKLKFDAACLKRDAYLDKALHIEASFLRNEVTVPNSDYARNFISENLKKLKLKPLSLSLSTETVELITEVCKEKNIPRDAFINRFFLLLIASDIIIYVLFSNSLKNQKELTGLKVDFEFWEIDWNEWRRNLGNTRMNTCFDRPNIIDSIEDFVEISPFWRLRDYFSNYEKDWKLYNVFFEKTYLNNLPDEYEFIKTDNIIGFNTFMADDDVSEQELLVKLNKEKAEADKLIAFTRKERKTRIAKTQVEGDT